MCPHVGEERFRRRVIALNGLENLDRRFGGIDFGGGFRKRFLLFV